VIKELMQIADWFLWLAKHPKENTSLCFWSKNFDVYVDGKLVMPISDGWHHLAAVANGHHAYIDEINMRKGKDVFVRLEGIESTELIFHSEETDGLLTGKVSDVHYETKPKWNHNFTPPTEKYPK